MPRIKNKSRFASIFVGLLALLISLISYSPNVYASQQTWDFGYTPSGVQPWSAPYTGTYQLEVWGAQGGGVGTAVGGNGGYSKGIIQLQSKQTIYIYVGEQGNNILGATIFGGGGSQSGGYTWSGDVGGSGGGATDIRTTQGDLSSRVIVAGGGGGAGGSAYGSFINTFNATGGYGGGITGGNGANSANDASYRAGAYGGTQTTGGSGRGYAGSFGQGGGGNYSSWYNGDAIAPGQGGGGWYGGGSAGNAGGGGGGGSGYIGGVQSGQTLSGNQSIPSPNGGTEVGQSGNGYARITALATPPSLTLSQNPTSWVSAIPTNHSLEVISGGDNQPSPQAIVKLDGNALMQGGRGWTMVAFDPHTFQVINQVNYDTYGNPSLGDNLATDINNLPNGSIVSLAINDAIGMPTTNLRNALSSLGLPNASSIGTDSNTGYPLPGQRMSLSYSTYKAGSSIFYGYDVTGTTIIDKSMGVATVPVMLSATGSDSYSGMENIQLPNGTWVNGSNASYIVNTNGNYTFVAQNNSGLTTTKNISVTNIDSTAPNLTIVPNTTGFTNGTVTMSVSASDSQSGVSRIELPNGNWVNGSSASYTVGTNGNYTFNAQDNVGNQGSQSISIENIIFKPTLTVNPNSNGNYMGLSWTIADSGQNYSYMLYKQSQGTTEFQTIPAKSTVSVLDVYPPVSQTITFTNWKGQTFTLPASASLKMWMEQPNSEDPKGYGKGLINVDTVSLTDFNTNPNTYLKNPDGSWKYDAVFFGAWDCNGACDYSGDISTSARDSIVPFIQEGRGVMFGHDTLIQNEGGFSHPNFTSLRSYVDIDNGGMDGLTGVPWIGSAQVQIMKKGLLTNYPWKIGDVGTVLNTPYSHTTGDIAMGDVWMQYYTPGGFSSITNPNTGTGTNNFYLTTWNNTAMIQTGHSSGQGSPDEQKVIANTLFYLSQVTNQTSWNDHSGQDLASPDMPTITNVTANGNSSQINVSYTPVKDNGSTYSYYVEATGETNHAKTDSNIVTSTITSGLKGYSIVIDNNPNTVPDNTIETTTTSYTVNEPINGNFYVHVASVDNAGNLSQVETYHYVDNNPPSLTITPSDTVFVNHSITLTANALDGESGVRRIQTPDGNWINSSIATYTVETNGTYAFIAEDFVGNRTTKSITISNIDETPPTSPNITANSSWTNASYVPVTISVGTDNGSGVNRTEYSLSGATNQDWTRYNGVFNITNEGITTITARSIDNVGNISSIVSNVVKIDRTSPINASITIKPKS